MAGAEPGPDHTFASGFVPPGWKRSVPAGHHCPRIHAEPAASRANAATRIFRAGIRPRGARICCPGSATSWPRQDRRPLPRRPERCDNAEYGLSAQTTGDSIMAALNYMRQQPFVRKDASVVVRPFCRGVGRIVSGGSGSERPFPRSSHSRRGVAAAPMIARAMSARPGTYRAAAGFGEGARVPVTWLVAENNSYFSPAFSQRMADAFRDAGGKVDFRVLPPSAMRGTGWRRAKRKICWCRSSRTCRARMFRRRQHKIEASRKNDDDVRYAWDEFPHHFLRRAYAAFLRAMRGGEEIR